LGTYQIVPLERAGDRAVLVNRGWIPQKRTTPLDEPAGAVAVNGYVRPGDRAGWFSAADDPAARQFYTLDPSAIGAAVNILDLEPFVLVAIGAPGAYPIPAEHLPRPPNNHLSYAITWYGLAGALLVISGAWLRKALPA
jgi:surfeit locus 1 family protein